jgi:DNA segregation ATPase FtsK/SpoIIIE, S-DNA-T family
MDGLTLIGRVGRDILRSSLDEAEDDAGTARFLLQKLKADEMAAIVRAILEEPEFAARLDICLPDYAFRGIDGIPEVLLTDRNTTDLRHADCDREARLMALLDEAQAQSMKQVEPIGAASLLDYDRLDLWLKHSGAEAALVADHIYQWRAAMRALLELDRVSLRQFADYLIAVAAALAAMPVETALGTALPRLDVLTDCSRTSRQRGVATTPSGGNAMSATGNASAISRSSTAATRPFRQPGCASG